MRRVFATELESAHNNKAREEHVQRTGTDHSARSAVIASAVCFGALSGLVQAAVMLFTDLPSLELPRMVWTSF